LKLFKGISGFDLVFLQRRLLQPWVFALLRRKAERLVFDFDDALMYRDSNRRSPFSLARAARFMTAAAGSDGVLAGNAYLAEKARRFNKSVEELPTVIDVSKFKKDPELGMGKPLTLGWMGSPSTFFYLLNLRGALEKVAAEHPGLRLLLVGAGPADPSAFKGFEVVQKEWKECEEVEDLREMDIGLAPLTDDPWSRGKCGLKILQYFAAGRPVVASPVGVQKEIILHGENGFLAPAEKDWVDELSRLIQDETLRLSMGEAGRKRVAQDYSLERTAPRFGELLLRVLSGKQSPADSGEIKKVKKSGNE
jgi:glycosyltransferase involved in cell wall biosynthesis